MWCTVQRMAEVMGKKSAKHTLFMQTFLAFSCDVYECLLICWLCLLIPRPFKQKNPFLAPLRINRELHKGGERSCMHIEFDITGASLKYTAGDHVALLPENCTQLVEKIADLLSVDLETVFSLVNKDGECSCNMQPLPQCTSVLRTLIADRFTSRACVQEEPLPLSHYIPQCSSALCRHCLSTSDTRSPGDGRVCSGQQGQRLPDEPDSTHRGGKGACRMSCCIY